MYHHRAGPHPSSSALVCVQYDSISVRSSATRGRCAMGDDDNDKCRIPQPINNENPVLTPIFAFRLQQWISAKYPRFRRLWEYGVDITSRHQVVVWDATHAIRHQACPPNQPPFSFASPFQPSPAPHLSPELLAIHGVDVVTAMPPSPSGSSAPPVSRATFGMHFLGVGCGFG